MGAPLTAARSTSRSRTRGSRRRAWPASRRSRRRIRFHRQPQASAATCMCCRAFYDAGGASSPTPRASSMLDLEEEPAVLVGGVPARRDRRAPRRSPRIGRGDGCAIAATPDSSDKYTFVVDDRCALHDQATSLRFGLGRIAHENSAIRRRVRTTTSRSRTTRRTCSTCAVRGGRGACIRSASSIRRATSSKSS